MMDGSQATADSISPFLRLPEELRQAIYKYALIADAPIQWPDDHNEAHLTPALLRACRKIHREATPTLYSNNTLAFQHPSDANMFGWAHSPDLARQVTSIALHIRDKDVRSLWTGYLSSTDPYRSLVFDYPALTSLNITFRSNSWLQMAGPAIDKLQQWKDDPHLRDLRHSFKERISENLKVRLIAVHRATVTDVRNLLQIEELKGQLRRDPETGEVRSGYLKFPEMEVALALVPNGPL